MTEVAKIDLAAARIQRSIVSGDKFQHARHVVLTVTNPKEARRWLRSVAAHVSWASPRDERSDGAPAHALNIGFTYRGLEKLQLGRRWIAMFEDRAPAFVEGATMRSGTRLGDSGDSDSERWDPQFHHLRADILLLLTARDVVKLEAEAARLQGLEGGETLLGWATATNGSHLHHDPDHRRVHFGYKDAITRPRIGGIDGGPATNPAKDVHAPGEFLLGHPNNEGANPWVLADQPDEVSEFFRHASFCVYRKMQQHVKVFKDFVDRASAALKDASHGFATPEYIRAKLCGRWDDGQVVSAQSPSAPPSPPPASVADMNDFDFSNDRDGVGCPFGAHIRRMNPRADPVVPFKRRPLIRRGIPYGAEYTDSTSEGDRGLLGVFFCASIEDQFEHLIAEWGNKTPIGTKNRGDAKDPLVGNHGSTPSSFDIPLDGTQSLKLTGFSPWVTTKGTLYAFFPSLPALDIIAREPAAANESTPSTQRVT